MSGGHASGIVSHIQRASTSDGPGLRTTVFLKGCPLDCLWCHNPETRGPRPELLFYAANCTGCGACVRACPNAAHGIDGARHILNRDACTACGLCAGVCPAGALILRGSEMTAEAVVEIALRDVAFYRQTGGGLTLSGGEPLAQPDFSRAILKAAKAAGLHTCLDTSGFGPISPEWIPLVDLFLWDVKESGDARHLRATGVAWAPIRDALRAVDAGGGKTRLRCPVVPGISDREDHARAIGALAEGLRNVQGIDLIPYHPLGLSKAQALCVRQPAFEPPTAGARAAFLAALRDATAVPAAWIG